MDEFRISTDPMPKNRLTKPFVGKRSILFDIYVSVEQNRFARVKQGIKISPTCNRAFCEPRHSAGAGGVTRTRDLRITPALLYQLSYTSTKYTEQLRNTRAYFNCCRNRSAPMEKADAYINCRRNNMLYASCAVFVLKRKRFHRKLW